MALLVDIASYEGPMDLLLQLIKKNEIQIEDIPIQEITHAYLEVIEGENSISQEDMGDFIVLASKLLYIKSRMLLPTQAAESEEEDPRESLIQRLRAYQAFREMTHHFRELEDYGLRSFTKTEEDLSFLSHEPIQISREVGDLLIAMNSLLTHKKRERESIDRIGQIVEREEYEIEDAIQKITQTDMTDETALQSFVEFDRVGEWIALFIAVLELVKRRWLLVRVRKGTIYLRRRESD